MSVCVCVYQSHVKLSSTRPLIQVLMASTGGRCYVIKPSDQHAFGDNRQGSVLVLVDHSYPSVFNCRLK